MKEGKTWGYLITDANQPNDYFFRTETISGDTIIDGTKCKKAHYCEWDGKEYGVWPKLEEDGKVYFFSEKNGRCLMMDFNMSVGDVYDANNGHTYSVAAKDSIEVRGVKRSRLTIMHNGDFAGYWVEGIGSSCDDARLTPKESSWGETCYIYECYDNGELIFTMRDFEAPTVTGISVVETDKNADGKIYDVNGIRIDTPQKGRIYIQNGKKFVK